MTLPRMSPHIFATAREASKAAGHVSSKAAECEGEPAKLKRRVAEGLSRAADAGYGAASRIPGRVPAVVLGRPALPPGRLPESDGGRWQEDACACEETAPPCTLPPRRRGRSVLGSAIFALAVVQGTLWGCCGAVRALGPRTPPPLLCFVKRFVHGSAMRKT